MPNRLVAALTMIMGVQILCAQTNLINSYTVADGLVMNSIRGFHQDAQGFIWIYTWDGISRYEGYRFRNYVAGKELQHGMVNDMHEGADGTMYIALNNGDVAIMRNSEIQSHVHIQGDVINRFFENQQGQLLATSDFQSIGYYHKETFTPLSTTQPGLPVTSAMTYRDSLFIVVSGRTGLGIVNANLIVEKRWTQVTEYYLCHFRNQQDQVLIGTADGCKTIHYDESKPDKYSLQDVDFIPDEAPWKHKPINAITQSSDGTYWFGTNNGLIQYKVGHPWTLYTKGEGLPSNSITSLLMDQSSTLWIGTEVGVASMYTQRMIHEVAETKGVAFHSMLPLSDGSILGLGNYRELLTISASGAITYNEQLAIEPAYWSAIGKKENDVLVLTASNAYPIPLNQVSPASSFASTFGAPGGISVLRNHIISLSDYAKCCYTADGEKREFRGTDLRIHVSTSFGKDKLLIGTWQDGLLVAEFDSLEPCSVRIIKDLTRWLHGKEIRCLLVDTRGAIWVGTRYDGITRLSCDDGFNHCDVQHFSMADGLISNWVKQVVEDRSGNIWAGSISGLDKLIPEAGRYRVFSFSRVSGFFGNILNLTIGANDMIWCSTNENLFRIWDEHIDTLPPPTIFLTEAVLGGTNGSAHQSDMRTLAYDHNSANFAFSAPDYLSGDQLKYTFRLLGSADSSWTLPASNQQIFYGNLQPGNYQFEVAAIGWNGERGIPVAYAFSIRPPYWRQWWFIALLCITGLSLLFWIYKFRIAQIRRIQHMRERIASDLHDEIGSTLTHVNILSEIGKNAAQAAGKPMEMFERIGAEVQSSSEALDDIIWSVKTQRDVVGDIIARMRQYATELFTPADIEFQLLEEILHESGMDIEFRRDLYLMYKELLRNIIRHAEATRVDILLRIDKKYVTLIVTDNGRGFDPDSLVRRSGLANIDARAQKWSGQVLWNSAPRQGTRVNIRLKP